MMHRRNAVLAAATILTFNGRSFLTVTATPTGAGGCDGISGSLGGPHLDPNATIIAGTLDDLNATVAIGATGFLEVGKPFDFMVGERYPLVMSVDTFAEDQEQFRGFLFRLSGPTPDVDTKGSLTVSPDLPVLEQISMLCLDLDLAGITHIDNNLKSQVEAILFMPEPQANLTLHVTAVVQNRLVDIDNVTEFVSEYYYDEFTLNAVVPETPAPTIWVSYPPTIGPTGAPTTVDERSGCASPGMFLIMLATAFSTLWSSIIP